MSKKVLPPIHLACTDDELRIAMQYVKIKDGIAYATNTHLLACINLKHHSELSEDVIKELDGKYVHAETWASVMDADMIFIEGNEILYSKGLIKARFEISDDINFPDIEIFIKESMNPEIVQLSKVSFNPLYVELLRKVFKHTEMTMLFKGGRLLCYPCVGSYQYAILMPIQSNEVTDEFEFDIS